MARSAFRMGVLGSLIVVLMSGTASADANKKLDHYCANWGAAGLFADDTARLADNPLATFEVARPGGGTAKILLLYIMKGHELDGQRDEWAEVWNAFALACPGRSKPAWLVKLEQWKRDQLRKSDPGRATNLDKAKALRMHANARSLEARRLRADIETSNAYLAITGGNPDWFREADAKAAELRRVAALGTVRYTVIGRVQAADKTQVTIDGVAMAPKTEGAPGTRVTPTMIVITELAPGAVRRNGNFYAEGLFQSSVVTPTNPLLTFAPTLSRTMRTQVSSAKAELRKVEGVLRGGKTKLAALMRPVVKLEALAAQLEKQADELEGK